MFLWGHFEIFAPKTLENIKKNLYWDSFLIKLHDCSRQPATALKLPLQILFWNSSEKKGCLQISRKLSKTFFSTDSSPEYPTSAKTEYTQNISC